MTYLPAEVGHLGPLGLKRDMTAISLLSVACHELSGSGKVIKHSSDMSLNQTCLTRNKWIHTCQIVLTSICSIFVFYPPKKRGVALSFCECLRVPLWSLNIDVWRVIRVHCWSANDSQCVSNLKLLTALTGSDNSFKTAFSSSSLTANCKPVSPRTQTIPNPSFECTSSTLHCPELCSVNTLSARQVFSTDTLTKCEFNNVWLTLNHSSKVMETF